MTKYNRYIVTENDKKRKLFLTKFRHENGKSPEAFHRSEFGTHIFRKKIEKYPGMEYNEFAVRSH